MKSLQEFMGDVFKYKLKVHSTLVLRENYKHANGCGAKGGVKFPKTMWGLNIESACILHDMRWDQAKNYQDLLDANEQFDNDLKTICDQESLNSFMRWLRRMRIAKYVSGVELFGTESYAIERGFDRRV